MTKIYVLWVKVSLQWEQKIFIFVRNKSNVVNKTFVACEDSLCKRRHEIGSWICNISSQIDTVESGSSTSSGRLVCSELLFVTFYWVSSQCRLNSLFDLLALEYFYFSIDADIQFRLM
jgi:hypothetical protein